jgi:hypothetical protein
MIWPANRGGGGGPPWAASRGRFAVVDRGARLSSDMLARSWILAAVLGCTCVVLGAPTTTSAGGEAPDVDGDRFGPIVAQAATAVRVDRATLKFAVAEDLASAAVTATYELTNPGAATDLEAAFVHVRGHVATWRGQQRRPYEDEAISVDGSGVAFRVVRDVEVVEPALTAWLAANPPVEEGLRELARKEPWDWDERLEPLVAAAGGRCEGGCHDILRWYRDVRGFGGGDDRDEWIVRGEREDRVVDAAREAIPGVVEALTRDWTTGSSHRRGLRRMDRLSFHLDFAAGQTRTMTVHYTHRPSADPDERANPFYTYEFLLAPARSWAGFGPLAVAIDVPGRTQFASSSPFEAEGEQRRVVLPGPHSGELRFEVMPLRGLWFGVTSPGFYFLALTIAVVLTTLAVSRVITRHRTRLGPGTWRTILHALGSGLLAMLAPIAVYVLGVLLTVFPARVLAYLGGDFSPLFEGALLFMLPGLIGSVVSLVAASRVASRFGGDES